ncbi:hypothetical protein Sa4125_30090 [Aureimonas sp. SA4125]|uniref:hypothetical protein n=1 Tax=Aureimonas sp. SA4125 TaxID=2826993 RepID=UPI001CC66B35|nr:hypothetical protein [Aureimonas sp. SA4125]BDA85467.1 hypothetical protein Sa4125_30090 [Aureimonas sp. SA4125]
MAFVDTEEGHNAPRATGADIERLRHIVTTATQKLFAQIAGGRIRCESEATLQLHLGRIISTVADLELVDSRETISIELEKPLIDASGRSGRKTSRGRIDIWFRIGKGDGSKARCAIELKFFKRANHREPNNRYDAFSDISRLERCADVADVGFSLIATDHTHYHVHPGYSDDTKAFDFRDGASYRAGTPLTYKTAMPYGDAITLGSDYEFRWTAAPSGGGLGYLLLEVAPRTIDAAPTVAEEAVDD